MCVVIGHDEHHCEAAEKHGLVARFGKDLRASPIRRAHGSRFATPVANTHVARGLNFMGEPKTNAKSAASSTHTANRSKGDGHKPPKDALNTQEETGEGLEQHVEMPRDVSVALQSGVTRLRVEEQKEEDHENVQESESDSRKGRVSFSGDYYLSGSSTSVGGGGGRRDALALAE